MPEPQEARSRVSSSGRQIMVLGAVMALGASAAGLVFLAGGHGEARAQAAPPPQLSRFIPPKEQLAALEIEPVRLAVFRTQVITDGVIAANGGFAPAEGNGLLRDGAPVLPGQSAEVLQAESDFTTARAQYVLASGNEKRQRALYQTGGTALKDLQQAEADLASALSSLASARNRLSLLGWDSRQIALLERARAGSGGAFAIGNGSHLWLIANVREEDVPDVRLGDAIEVRVPAYPGKVFHAKLDYIASLIDPNTHRLVVGALIANPDGMLRANMSAAVTIEGGQAMTAPAIPSRAVIYEGDRARVWVAGRDGSLALRDIVLGRANGDRLEVTRGLAAGEKIVTGGALFIDRAASGT